MLRLTTKLLLLVFILMISQLSATVTQSGSSDLEGNTGWMYDYSALGSNDTTYLNNTVYKATFTFDVTDNHDSYFIYLGTDDNENGNYLDDQASWGTYVKSGIFSGSQTLTVEALYSTLDDHNADYSNDDKKLKFFVRRRGIVDADTDTLELSGIYEWHLESPQSPVTPDLQSDDDTGTSSTDNETNLSSLNFDVSSLPVSGTNFEVQLTKETWSSYYWRSSNTSTALTALTITTSATMTLQYDSFFDGTWYLRANVKDQYGSISYSGNRTVHVDTQAPSAPNILDLKTTSDTGSNTSDNKTNDQTPTFIITPSSGNIMGDDISRVYFSGTVVTLTDSIIASGFPNNQYSSDDITVQTGELTTDNEYQVYAIFIDDAGNASSSSDSLTFTLDTTEPSSPAKPDLESSDDTGFLTTDNLTNKGTLTDDIQLTIGSLTDSDIDSVYLVMDNTDTLGRIELGVGNTSYTFTVNGLSEADHTFKALVKDDAGNESADSQGLSVTIDTTASSRPTLDLKTSSDAGRKNDDNLTNDDTPTMTVENLSASDSVIFYDNGSSIQSSLVNAASMDITLNQLENGSHPLTVKAEDPAGNFSLSSTPTVNVRIDTDSPSQPDGPDLKDASDTGHASNDDNTSDTTPEFTIGSVTATIDSIVLNIAGQTIGQVPTGSFIDITVPLSISPDGNYTVYATKIDSAGNTTDGSSMTIAIDTEDPSTPAAPDLTAATDTGTENDDDKTMEMQPVFTVSNISIGDSLHLKFLDSSGDTTIYARAKADATDETLTAGSDVAEGTHNVWVLAIDLAGNQTEGNVLTNVEIDTTPPAQIGSIPDLQESSDSGFKDDDNLTSDRTPSFNITSLTDADSILLYFDNSVVISSMVPGGATSVVLTAPQQNAGTYSKQVKVKRIDVVGNTSVASDSIKLRIDTDNPTTPSLTGILPADDSGFLNSDGYTNDDTPSLIVTNVEGVDSITVTLDGVSNDYTRRTIVSQAGTDTLTIVSSLSDDVYQLTAVAKDSAGNLSGTSGILRVTIDTDPTDPTLTNLSIDLSGTSDTGTDSTDNFAKDMTPTFRITNATITDSLYIQIEDGSSNSDIVDGEIATAEALSMTSQNLTTLSNITYSDGDYTFYVFPKDSAGNIPNSGLWPSLSVEFDTDPPNAAGISVDLLGTDDSGRDSTDEWTNELQPTFRISGLTAQDSVYLVAGTDTITRDISTTTFKDLIPDANLPESSMSVKALARDYAGNLSDASAVLTVVTDTTAPSPPNTADLHENYDSGFYLDDDVTKNSILGFIIDGLVDGDSITFYINNVVKSFTAIGGYSAPNASGGEVGLLHAPSAPGSLTVKSAVTDSAGNTSAISGEMVVKLDQTPPSNTDKPDLVDASDSGNLNDDDYTNDLTPSFSIADVTSGDSVYVTISSGGESDTTGVGFAAGNTIQITLSDLTSDNVSNDDGVFLFTAFAVDSAGNASASVSSALSVTIDATAPSAPIITLRAGDDSGVLNDDQLTNVMNPQFNIWNADGEDSLYIAAGSDTVFRGVPDENPDIVSTDSTTEGTISYTALLRDKAGNLSSVSTAYPVVIDTTRPGTPSLPNLLSASDAGFDDEDNITNVTLPNFVLTGLTPSTIDSALIYFDGSVAGSQWISQPLIDTLQIDPQSFNPVEIIGVSVGAIDSAGNVSLISDTLIIKIDTDPPTTSDPDLIPSSDLGESSTDDVTSDNTPTILFSNLEPGSINKLYRIAPGPPADTVLVQVDTVAAEEDTLSLTPSSPLPDDTYTVYSTTEDTAGNVVESGDLLNLVIDTQEPSAVISLEDSLVRLEDLSDTVRVNFSEGMSNPPQISVRYAGGAVQDTSDMTAEFDSVWFFLLDIPDSNDGTATISITATDNASNELDSLNIVGRTLLKIDNTDPIFSSITPDTGAFVNYTQVAYTISEHANNPSRLDSASFIWTPIGAGSTIQSDLSLFELDVGAHALGTLTNDPQLEDGVLYTLSITSLDSAGNEGTTIVNNVAYDTTSLSALLTYSSYLTRGDSTVTITATFSEQTGGIPSLLIEYNSGAGDSDSGNMSDQSGDSTVWFYDALIPSGVVNNDTALVSITTTDRALNSLTTDSTFFRDTLLIDNSTASVLSLSTSDSLVKELDVDTVTVVYDEPMRPFPMLEVLWAGGDTLESSQMTEVNGTDSTEWIFVISSVPDSNDGFATVVINAFDDAGNPITSSSSDIIEVDNVHPTFTDISPDSNTFVNHKNIAYTLSEELESGTVTWQWTSGVMDPVTHIDTLIGAELLAGVHESFEPANAPDLTDGSVYRVMFDGFDYAVNAAVQTISGSVMYDTTSLSALLMYSSYLTRADSTVIITATFSEQTGDIPFLLIEYNSGAGDSDSGNMTDQSGDSTVWFYDALIPSGVVNNDTALVTITTTDRALNSLTTDSTFFRDTLFVDNSPSSVLSLTTSDSLVKELDVDTVTVVYNEPMRPSPMLEVLWAGGDTLVSSQMTEVQNTDSTEWIFVISSVPDSNDGFATVVINALDDAGNPIISSNSDIIEVDNIHPTFTSVSPDSNSFVNHKNIAYTLSEELESGTVTWEWTGGVVDPVTHIDTLIGAELLAGVHETFEPANAPDITDGSVYRVTFDGFDFAVNAAVQTISGSVMYDTTGPTVDSLVYSKNPAMPGDTVEVKAYFNEIVPTAPSFITAWPGLGGGGPFSLDSTLDGGMLVWLTEVEVPGISVSGNVVVTPTALDRATNPIDSLGGMETDLFDTTWYIDVDAPTCSLTYANIDQPTLTNLGKGGDEVQITATFNEKAKGFSDAVPRLTIIFTDTSDHSIEGTPFTASSNGDTTWTYSFDLPSDSSYTGFLTVRLAAYDLAGNLVEDVVDTNVFEIDNIPPALFTTGTVIPMGTLPKPDWFNQRTDSVAVLVPIDSEDPSLFQGKVQIRMQIDGVPTSITDVGMSVILTNISQDKTVDLMRDTVSTAFDPADFVEGAKLLSWAELYDLAGNVTEGTQSTDTLVVDTIPPVMGSWSSGIVVSADTVISSDSLSAVWTGFSENIAAGESGINYYDWTVGRFGSTNMDSIMAWTTVTDTSADTLLPLRHLEIYNISLRAVDNAGNRSDTLVTDVPGILRLNSAPELVAVDSQFVDEDVQFTYQIIGTDIDTTTLLGDTLHYTLIDTAGILIPDTSLPLVIGEYTGLIDWNTPLQADTGTYSFNVRVGDEWGFADTTGIVLTVSSVNDTPQVSLIPNVTFMEDIINGDTLSLHQYVTDVDNDTTELIWVAVVMPDSTNYPSYPNFFFGPGSTPELRKIIRQWVLNEPIKKEFTLLGKSGTDSHFGADSTLEVNIDTLNGSAFAYFIADSNYYVNGREVIFVATDPMGAADSTSISVTIVPENDPPVITVMLDTLMAENDTLILALGAIDIDDSSVTFQVLPDTSAMNVTLNDTLATFIPDQFWVDSTIVLVIVSDEEFSDSTSFMLRVERVIRPMLALSIGQNATFTRYFEFIVTDTAEKALDISLTIQQTGEQVALDTVGDFTWVGHHSFDTTMTYNFVMFGDAKVGDTTVTRSAELALAKANAGWIASSSDGKFQIISGVGAVAYDRPFMIVDSLLFAVYDNTGGLYRIGHPLLNFEKPVMITLSADTTLADEDQALYLKSEEEVWQELPTISQNGVLMAWTSKMGYFKIGRKNIFIPEHTSIQQNYPNPFNSQTRFIYDIGFFGGPDQKMIFVIYNLLGQEVYRIAKGNAEIGRHEFIWNGADNFGVPVSTGIYIARLTTNAGFSSSKKMMLIK